MLSLTEKITICRDRNDFGFVCECGLILNIEEREGKFPVFITAVPFIQIIQKSLHEMLE